MKKQLSATKNPPPRRQWSVDNRRLGFQGILASLLLDVNQNKFSNTDYVTRTAFIKLEEKYGKAELHGPGSPFLADKIIQGRHIRRGAAKIQFGRITPASQPVNINKGVSKIHNFLRKAFCIYAINLMQLLPQNDIL
ncbi:hypothetical protein P378_02165 [Desulforamulus profundi]|uniref:Uncharacterized protein n=1 Tax=Desulforamulus profundi TaxID=1383067 RepID=A0A2C6LM20_9FIRM|nr:hypothetical protein P378_02165 [Desulforamulus profundi]